MRPSSGCKVGLAEIVTDMKQWAVVRPRLGVSEAGVDDNHLGKPLSS